MNHLRELIDNYKNNNVFFMEHLTDDRCDEVSKDFDYMCKDTICFYMGDLCEVLNNRIIKDLEKLPYDKCWFECTEQKGGLILGFLCINTENGGYVVQAYKRHLKRWVYACTFERDFELNNIKVVDHIINDVNKHEAYENIINYFRAFLCLLNCNNLNRIEHSPSKNLQKSRQSKGKLPLFSYYTLELNLKSRYSKKEYQGGTHSSPRIHLRRGHAREYLPGAYCWVQPCVVGHNVGVIHKDYMAKLS